MGLRQYPGGHSGGLGQGLKQGRQTEGPAAGGALKISERMEIYSLQIYFFWYNKSVASSLGLQLSWECTWASYVPHISEA